MDMYSYMIQNLPPLYRTENNLKRYKVIANEMKKLFDRMNNLQLKYIIQTADLETLLVLGDNLNVKKEDYMTTEIYRKFVLIAYSNMFLVPTHNNLMNVIRKITGFHPTMQPLHTFGEQIENDQGLYIAYDVTNDYNTSVLLELEKLVGAGIKIRRDFLYKVEGVTIYPATYLFNNDTINIDCEIKSPSQNWDMKQDLTVASSYLQIANTNV